MKTSRKSHSPVKNNAEVPKRYFILDIARMMPGDILLSTTDEFGSAGIRFGTKAVMSIENKVHGSKHGNLRINFSHVAIYVGDNMLYEAIPSGVVPRNVLSMAFADKGSVKVLRLKKDEHLNTDAVRAQAIKFINAQHMKEYANPINFVNRFKDRLLNTSSSSKPVTDFICSHLVFAAYESANLSLLEKIDGKNVTPAELELSEHLKDVTDEVLKLGKSKNLEGLVFIDRKSTKRMVESESEITIKVVRRLKKHFENEKMAIPMDWSEALYALMEAPITKQKKFDRAFLNALEESGYFEHCEKYFAETKDIPYIDKYILFWLLNNQPSDDDIQEHINDYNQFLSGALKDLEVRKGMVDTINSMYEKTGLETFRILKAIREKSLKNAQSFFEALERAAICLDQANSWKEWWENLGYEAREETLTKLYMELVGLVSPAN